MRNILGITIVIACAIASPASGHHSEAGIDMNSVVTFEGTVREFSWRNPHVYLVIETTSENGDSVEWLLQMGSIVTAGRAGWTRDSLSVGDRITIRTHP
ncbi:MAG: DUF6152 family protein, partial [Gammaproteobacteria bacterium]